jgi:hypothetical protein
MEAEALGTGSGASDPLGRVLRAVSVRVRVQRGLSQAAIWGLAAGGLAAIGLCVTKTTVAGDGLPWFATAAGLAPLGLLIGLLRPVPPLLSARLLDRALDRSDLFASAWAFARIPIAERSPFMQACLRQAHARAAQADPRAAMPLRAPRALRPLCALGAGLGLLALVHVPAPVEVAASEPVRPRLLHQDDVEAFREHIAPLLAAQVQDPFVQESARELNALLEALHEGEIDRGKALAELRVLEKKLELSAVGEDDEALREALRGLGRTLERDALAKSVAEAMQAADAAAARAELEKLATSLQHDKQRPEALRSLEKALSRAGQPDAAREKQERALAEKREELERLLKKKREQGQPEDARQERLLRDKKRELEKLEREQAKRDAASRKLDRLRRDLSRAAAPLAQRRAGDAGKQLEQAAEGLAEAQRQQLSEQQRRQLSQRVAQLREMLSKQRGQGQDQAQEEREGQAGGGRPQRLDAERMARLARGQGQQPGQPQQEGSEGQPGGKLLMPGQPGADGEPDGMLMMQGQGQARMQMQGEPMPESSQAGEGGRPETAESTRLAGKRVDTRVQGEQGAGATRSEVILEAGQRGFVSRDYQRVHGEYERHAEAVLERDRVPGGYRFYVRRYFQLIRPREGGP